MGFLGSRCRPPGLGIVLSLLCVAAAAQQPAAEALTLDVAVRLARERSSAVAAQRAQVQAAREQAVAAGQRPDPMLKLGVNGLPVEGDGRFQIGSAEMTTRSVMFAQTFTRDGKLRARRERFDREADAAHAAGALQGVLAARNAAAAWLERHHQERIVALLQAQRAEAVLQLEGVDATFRAGRGMPAEAFDARLAVAQVDEALVTARAAADEARIELARWVGEAAGRALAPPPPMGDPLPVDLAARIDALPEIAQAAQREAVARAEAEMARQEREVDWSVEAGVELRGSRYTNAISVALSIPLRWDPANRQDRETAAQLARAEAARSEREELARERLAELERARKAWRAGVERLALWDVQHLRLAGERTAAAIAAYRGGSAALATVLQARRQEADLRLERERLALEASRLWVRLAYAFHDDTPSPEKQP